MFDFKSFFLGLSEAQREAFAAAAGTSAAYINLHLIRGRRVPRAGLMRSLVDACPAFGVTPTLGDFAAFFFQARPAAEGDQAHAEVVS